MQCQSNNYINQETFGLPIEICKKMIQYLPFPDLAVMTQVNSKLRAIAQEVINEAEKGESSPQNSTPDEKKHRFLKNLPPQHQHYIQVALGEGSDELDKLEIDYIEKYFQDLSISEYRILKFDLSTRRNLERSKIQGFHDLNRNVKRLESEKSLLKIKKLSENIVKILAQLKNIETRLEYHPLHIIRDRVVSIAQNGAIGLGLLVSMVAMASLAIFLADNIDTDTFERFPLSP